MSFVSFGAMSPSEAAKYFERFTAETSEALQRLTRDFELQTKFDRPSLHSLWEQLVPRIAWRSSYSPELRDEVFDARLTASTMPSWFHHPSGAGYERFSTESLWLIDGAARYLGETLNRRAGSRWGVGASLTGKGLYANQPVIVGLPVGEVSPIQSCAVIFAKELSHNTRSPRTLTDLYETWTA